MTETFILDIPRNEWLTQNMRLSNRDISTKKWDNRSGPRGATNTTRSLTHSLEKGKEGLAMNATRNVDLNCIVCGTAILDAQRRTKKYCSNDCSNARRRERYVPKPIGNNWVPLRDRLYSRALIKPTGCVEWQGYRLRYGHGQIMVRNEDGTTSLTTTHRAAWMIERGPIPEGLVVRHKCDNPPCVNIAHLELGTAADNSRDAVERGRVARGSALPQTVLTEDDVRNIRAEYRRFTIPGRRGYHTNKRQLAKKYGVSPGHIKEIVGRRERADVA